MNRCAIRDSAVGRRTIRDVLFWFLCLSCLSNHMTRPRPAGALWSQEDMGSGLRGASWDRTSSLVLCKGEDPCLGLFVFPALSSIPTLPYPPNAVPTSPALIALRANLCVWSVLSPARKHKSVMLPIHLLTRAWPLTPEHHSAADGETLCCGRLKAQILIYTVLTQTRPPPSVRGAFSYKEKRGWAFATHSWCIGFVYRRKTLTSFSVPYVSLRGRSYHSNQQRDFRPKELQLMKLSETHDKRVTSEGQKRYFSQS